MAQLNTYTTKQGDMWDSIAYQAFRDEYQIHILMEANPDHMATVIFPAGVLLTIPELTVSQSQNLPPWKVSS